MLDRKIKWDDLDIRITCRRVDQPYDPVRNDEATIGAGSRFNPPPPSGGLLHLIATVRHGEPLPKSGSPEVAFTRVMSGNVTDEEGVRNVLFMLMKDIRDELDPPIDLPDGTPGDNPAGKAAKR